MCGICLKNKLYTDRGSLHFFFARLSTITNIPKTIQCSFSFQRFVYFCKCVGLTVSFLVFFFWPVHEMYILLCIFVIFILRVSHE